MSAVIAAPASSPLWRHALIYLPWTSFLYVGYQLTNRYQLFEPSLLPLLPLEAAIPFLAWTVIPYFVLIAGMYLPIFLRSRTRLYQSLLAITVAVLINYSVFLLFPTVYERPPVPTGDGLGDTLYRWLIGIDTPANCFPSGHICVPFLGVWYLSQERPSWRPGLLALFAVLALSVLTTKQHYALDILGGLATAAVGIGVAGYWARRRRPA